MVGVSLIWLVVWFAVALSVSAGDRPKPVILTSIPPLFSWASNVAGELATVENLLPADVGPHDFQLRPRDLDRIQRADVVLINGLGLESWLERILAASGKNHQRVVSVADGIAPADLIFALPELKVGTGSKLHSHDHHGAANPHLWLDPILARNAVSNLVAALVQIDPGQAKAYETNGRVYSARLDRLDAEIRKETSGLLRRDVVTFHDAFPYFCRRYNFRLAGVIEEVPGASPSPRYLASLSQAIRDQGVKVVFTEPQFNPRLAQQLARDLKLSVAQLDVLETGVLSPTAYEDGMRKNLRSLVEALR